MFNFLVSLLLYKEKIDAHHANTHAGNEHGGVHRVHGRGNKHHRKEHPKTVNGYGQSLGRHHGRHGGGGHGKHHFVNVRDSNHHGGGGHHGGNSAHHSGSNNGVQNAIIDNIKGKTGTNPSNREKQLAHLGSHGDRDAIKTLNEEGAISDSLANGLLKRQNDIERGPQSADAYATEAAEDLLNMPHSSAPLRYSAMREVKPGEDPVLEKEVEIQDTMKQFRNYLPDVDTPQVNDVLDKADQILRNAPNGDINQEFVDSDGVGTGKSYKDIAEDHVVNNARSAQEYLSDAYKDMVAAGQSPSGAYDKARVMAGHPTAGEFKAAVAESVPGSLYAPEEIAEAEYLKMVDEGVDPAKAAAIAGNIQRSAAAVEAGKEEVRGSYGAALNQREKEMFHNDLYNDLEAEKVAGEIGKSMHIEDELDKQHSFPILDPHDLNEQEMGFLKGIKNVVDPKTIAEHADAAYMKSIESGYSPRAAQEHAREVADNIAEFNDQLRKGESVDVALKHIKDKADREARVKQRRSMLQSNDPDVAKFIERKTDVIQEGLRRIAETPGNKSEILHKVDDELKALSAEEAVRIHELENLKHIHMPKREAENIMKEAQELNKDLVDVAVKSPVVTKEILSRGVKSGMDTVKGLQKVLNDVDAHKKLKKPIPTSALKMLNNSKEEKLLKDLIDKNTENERKAHEKKIKEEEDQKVMRTEESLANKNKMLEVEEEGKRAAEEVLKSGGTIEEAEEAKISAENAAKRDIEATEAKIKNNVMRALGSVVEPEKLERLASHIASAHTGHNAVGKTPEEVLEKEEQERKKYLQKKAMYSDLSDVKIEKKSQISDDASQVTVDNSIVKFPLKTFVDEEAKSESESYVKNKENAIREAIRNTVTENLIKSGLNTIKRKDGYLNIPESAEKITINDGEAYFTPAAKLKMEKQQGIDTSKFIARYNQGEMVDIPIGSVYYVSNVKDMDLALPSPGNPTPSTFLSNEKGSLDMLNASMLKINKGTLHQTPWKDYLDLVKPKMNPYPDEHEKIEEATMLQDEMVEERKREQLDSIKVDTFTNPDGEKHISVKPPYGIVENFDEEEGMKKLSNIDPSENIAISETPTEKKEAQNVSPLERVPENEILNEFIKEAFEHAKSSGRAGKLISPINGFTGERSAAKSELLKDQKLDVSKQYLDDGAIESAVKNSLIQDSYQLSKRFDMTAEEFIGLVKMIPDIEIAKMIDYNKHSKGSTKDLIDTDFVKIISNLSTKAPAGEIIDVIFKRIAKVSNSPNNVTSELISQQILPNVNAISTTNITRTPGGTSVTGTIRQPSSNHEVISSQVIHGSPSINTPAGTIKLNPGSSRTGPANADLNVKPGTKSNSQLKENTPNTNIVSPAKPARRPISATFRTDLPPGINPVTDPGVPQRPNINDNLNLNVFRRQNTRPGKSPVQGQSNVQAPGIQTRQSSKSNTTPGVQTSESSNRTPGFPTNTTTPPTATPHSGTTNPGPNKLGIASLTQK